MSTEGPLARWSRRKREAAQERSEPKPAAQDAPPAEAQADAAVEPPLDLPDPDDLKEGDDFAAFMRDGVPAELRKRALRKLWSTNPILANLDGLVEYGEDYTNAAMVPETINTIYRVGRGMLSPEETEDETVPGSPEPEEIAGTAGEEAATASAKQAASDEPPSAAPHRSEKGTADEEAEDRSEPNAAPAIMPHLPAQLVDKMPVEPTASSPRPARTKRMTFRHREG